MPTFCLKSLQFGNPVQITEGICKKIAEFIAANIFYNSNGKRQRLLSYLGYLNNLIFCYACDRGVLTKVGKTEDAYRYDINKDAIPNLFGFDSIRVALSGTRKYLQEWWGKVSKSVDTIKEMRSRFSEMGLFTFEVPEYKIQRAGQPKVAFSSAYDNFDIVKALLVYEAIERLLVSEFGWDALPEHKGAMVKHIYDLVFKFKLGMRRSPDPDAGTGEAMSEQDVEMERAQRAKNNKNSDRNEYAILSEVLAEWRKAQYDRSGGELQQMFEEQRDRFEWLKNKLFGKNPPLVEVVPMDADLPF
jgi:hypothetical protein